MKKLINSLVQNWGRDSGHACVGVLLTVVAWALMPEHPYWAALIGGNAYSLPKEGIDISKHRPRRIHLGNVADYVSYQTGWPLVVTLHNGLGYGALVFLGIAGLYLVLVWKGLR